jgi:hypothetical protein
MAPERESGAMVKKGTAVLIPPVLLPLVLVPVFPTVPCAKSAVGMVNKAIIKA